MAQKIGSLVISLGLDSGAFKSGLNQAEKELKASTKRIQAIGESMRGIGQTMALGITVPLAGAFAAMTKSLVSGAKEIERSAQLANAGAEEFQRAAFAAKSVGIESEKLGDIYKDVNDRIGDFVQTGGGEMKDFFEKIAPKVGVTAEQFRKLSGPQALQLYYSSLEKAGLNQQDMTFYMEAMADEASGLIPLLKENGKAFTELGKKAAVMDKQDIADLKAFSSAMTALGESFKAVGIALTKAGVFDAIANTVNSLADLIRTTSETNPGLVKLAAGLALVAAAAGPVLWALGSIVTAMAPFTAAIGVIGSNGGVIMAARAAMVGLGAALGPILVPLAAIAAIGGVIYANWEKISPVLEEIRASMQAAVGPEIQGMINELRATLSELWDGPLGDAVRGVVSLLGDLIVVLLKAFGPVMVLQIKLLVGAIERFLTVISSGLQAVSRLLQGDFAGAAKAAFKAFDAMLFGIPTLIGKMVTAARDWLVGKLGQVWQFVLDKIETVKKAFFNLYDAVVGNSYVPDMVDGIAREMARLDAVMVMPVTKATDKAREAFAQLASDTQAIMARLFPEAAAFNTLQGERGTIDAAQAGGLLSPEAAKAASEKLLDEFRNDNPLAAIELPSTIIADTEALAAAVGSLSLETAKAGSTWTDVFGEMGITGQDVLQDISRSLTDAVMGARSLGEALQGVLQRLAEMALDAVFQQLLGGLFKSIGIPGFASGTSFAPGGLALVGERGPEIVNLPRGSQVIPNGPTERMLGQSSTVHSPTFVFPGITDARQAREAAGQAARRYRQEINGPLRRAG